MAFIPPDVRTARSFRITKGLDDNLIRTDYAVASGATPLVQGEWVSLSATNQASKATGATLADPVANPALVWTAYASGDTSAGQSDAAVLDQVTCVSGSFQAETKLFESTGTFNAGDLLVVQESTTTADQGVLNAVPVASATAKQIASSVGKVILLSGGVLSFRSNGNG